MGKTAEALQWAEKEYQVTRRDRSPAFLPAGRVRPPKRAWTHHPVMELYDDLKSNLLTRFLCSEMCSTRGGRCALVASTAGAIASGLLSGERRGISTRTLPPLSCTRPQCTPASESLSRTCWMEISWIWSPSLSSAMMRSLYPAACWPANSAMSFRWIALAFADSRTAILRLISSARAATEIAITAIAPTASRLSGPGGDSKIGFIATPFPAHG